jgi:hypothetical protein
LRSAATFNFFSQLQLTLLVPYAAREMHMSAGRSGSSSPVSASAAWRLRLTVGRIVARIGYGCMLVGGYALAALASLCLPLVPGPRLSTALFTGCTSPPDTARRHEHRDDDPAPGRHATRCRAG